jgi:hypothetical protein
MKKHYFVVAAALFAVALSFLPASAEDQGAFLRNPAHYAKGSFQRQALTQRQAPAFVAAAPQAVRAAARAFTPRQIERNARAVMRVPIDMAKKVFYGVDRAGIFLILRRGKNYTDFTCLQCGREQRHAAIAGGFRDCKYGDVTYGWKHPSCSTPAPAGAVNSLRITGPHIERVVGTCPNNPAAPVAVADGNGPGGVNTVRCVPLHGATYHYQIKAVGDPKVDGPFYMQPDPCNGRGRNPRHFASYQAEVAALNP